MPTAKACILWVTILIWWALQLPGILAADVIVLDDGRRIETPRAIVEGTQVYYYEDDEVHAVPHSRVREIQRGGGEAETPPPEGAIPVPYYLLAFKDGRQVRIDDYDDGGDVVQYTKYDVRVTIDKRAIRTITRISKDGEEVVFRQGGRPASGTDERQAGEEEALRRMSEESLDRALYNAVVDDEAIAEAAMKEKAEEKARCTHQCLQRMLACRSKCAEVLDALKAKQVLEDDPAYLMVKNEVVDPCERDCVVAEANCRNDCAKSPVP
jgi:hypothetical protein